MDFDDNDNNANNNDAEEVYDIEDDIFGGSDDPVIQDLSSRKDAVIFVIDCQPCLFQVIGGGGVTQMSQILNAFQSFLKSKIISNVDDRIGLIFFNSAREQNPLNFKAMDLVYALESPSADRIKNTINIEENFKKEYGFSNQNAALYEVLWLCNQQFKLLDQNKFSMRIFLFTPEDQPNFKDRNSRDQTIKHARQLKDMNVDIELFPLYKSEDSNFQINRFYGEIMTIDPDEINSAVLDSSQKIMDLQQRIRQKEYRKRALNRLLMDIGDDVQVGLKVFCLVNKARKTIGKPVERKTNSILKKKTQFLCADTGKPLFPAQIGTYFPLGNEKVKISKEQMAQIKGFEKPGMRLIGFKPSTSLKDYHNYRTSYFVYPDDEHVTGSSQFFDALINQMAQKQRIAIVRVVPRQGSTIRFCALIPQPEQYDDDHFQSPPGMHMVFLPYADDIRGLNDVKQEGRNVSRELVNCTKIMVNALTINDFDCTNFEDPSIQKFYAYLQGHALTEQQIDEPEDVLMPDYNGMDKYREIINLFQQAVDVECSDMGNTKAKARGGGAARGARGGGNVKKQQKMEDENDQPNEFQKIKPKKEEQINYDSESSPQPSKRGRGRGRGKK